MTQDLETAMAEALKGKFYSFKHSDCGEMSIGTKAVSPDYCHEYKFENQFQNGPTRGALMRVANHRAKMVDFWTKEKITELKRLRSLNFGARSIGRQLGTGRQEVGLKLNELGILSTRGEPYFTSYARPSQGHEIDAIKKLAGLA